MTQRKKKREQTWWAVRTKHGPYLVSYEGTVRLFCLKSETRRMRQLYRSSRAVKVKLVEVK